MPIYVRNPLVKGERKGKLEEWCIVELQGDLEVRGERIMAGQFIGDLLYNKYGQPILIIGHHILQGRMQKIDKPLLVVEKQDLRQTSSRDYDETMLDISQVVTESQQELDSTAHSVASNRTVLDSTVAIEHKVVPKVEYLVRAVVRSKVLFKARPKPIIANVAKTV
ncbi:chromosome transmission fidelity protein 8 homolog [Anopheles aquasalis]|uniref:chromosome transmission fidelity protein 8 homolog n=1 Tax=Anopheles aquasalis TaxID=42839 RepID=UPI00215AC05E|nr:chromosome transmission fidelity protein 8 homolog [Anopheles aquasalis]